MAFCTTCGANVTGAFCNQCGTPARAQGTPAVPPAAQPAPVVAPGPRKTSPIVWVLVIVLGLFVLGFIGVVGTGYFLVHKVRQAGLDPALISRNPGLAMAKLITAVNPDAEVIRTDENAGTITVRDRTNGKVMTFSFDDVRNGKFNMKVQGDDGKTATVEIGGAGGKLPSWVPSYPGSTAQGTFSVRGTSEDGSGEGGNFTFTTPDAPSKVMTFYQDKANELGMKANLTTNTPDGGMLIVADEGSQRTLTVVVGKGSPDTTVNVTYAVKK
ncbi:conserved hypothetical protein [Candidatus Sulfopaludibacter sp. SbA6]|nr:conserved hypothetical protein [Candidatus Sulfopaludibacter sp. SbA6]